MGTSGYNAAEPPPEVLKPGDLARMFGVDPKTVNKWAKEGRLPSFRTLGGHLRFHAADVHAYLHQNYQRRTMP